MKFIISKNKAINLENVVDIFVSSGYLKVTTDGGLNSREVSLAYGTDTEMTKLFAEVMNFIAGESKIFDCDKFMKTL